MPQAPPPIEQQSGVPRCRHCYYVLENLPEPRCPECGTIFDFNDPDSYTIKPPLVRWRLWLPGLALALFGGMALYLFVLPYAGFGWAATLVVPAAAGAILGYGCRVRVVLLVLPAIIVCTGLFFGLIGGGYVGLLCGLMLGGLALGPVAVGMAVGVLLRMRLKHSNFDQRWHLPLIAFLLLPVGAAVIERATYRPPPPESVQTSLVIAAPVGRVWDSIQFYEEVKHGPPPLFRLGMPRALFTTGRAAAAGDLKTCVYDKGRLTKRVTEVDRQRRLGFVVVEQEFERHAVSLAGGSFQFEPVGPAGQHTRVTLTTTYRPHLGPRWCWRPLEGWTVRTLHRHVLKGMSEETTGGGAGAPDGTAVADAGSGAGQ